MIRKRILICILLWACFGVCVACTQSKPEVAAEVPIEATEVPPTNTPNPPTETPIPPTDTPEPTATPIPPTETPEPTASTEPVEVQITEWEPLVGRWKDAIFLCTLKFREDGTLRSNCDTGSQEGIGWFEGEIFFIQNEYCWTEEKGYHTCTGQYIPFIGYQGEEPVYLRFELIVDDWSNRAATFQMKMIRLSY